MIKICLCHANYKCQLCRQETILDKIREIKTKLNDLTYKNRNIHKALNEITKPSGKSFKPK